jgi:hypothetical protein
VKDVAMRREYIAVSRVQSLVTSAGEAHDKKLWGLVFNFDLVTWPVAFSFHNEIFDMYYVKILAYRYDCIFVSSRNIL